MRVSVAPHFFHDNEAKNVEITIITSKNEGKIFFFHSKIDCKLCRKQFSTVVVTV